MNNVRQKLIPDIQVKVCHALVVVMLSEGIARFAMCINRSQLAMDQRLIDIQVKVCYVQVVVILSGGIVQLAI